MQRAVIQSHGMIISLFSMDKINTYSDFELCSGFLSLSYAFAFIESLLNYFEPFWRLCCLLLIQVSPSLTTRPCVVYKHNLLQVITFLNKLLNCKVEEISDVCWVLENMFWCYLWICHFSELMYFLLPLTGYLIGSFLSKYITIQNIFSIASIACRAFSESYNYSFRLAIFKLLFFKRHISHNA